MKKLIYNIKKAYYRYRLYNTRFIITGDSVPGLTGDQIQQLLNEFTEPEMFIYLYDIDCDKLSNYKAIRPFVIIKFKKRTYSYAGFETKEKIEEYKRNINNNAC